MTIAAYQTLYESRYVLDLLYSAAYAHLGATYSRARKAPIAMM